MNELKGLDAWIEGRHETRNPRSPYYIEGLEDEPEVEYEPEVEMEREANGEKPPWADE